MCIQTKEIFCDGSTLSALSWLLFFVNAGIISSKQAPAAKSSFRVNPRSANTWSPGMWNLFEQKLDSKTIRISDARPPQHFDKNFFAPSGLNQNLKCRHYTEL